MVVFDDDITVLHHLVAGYFFIVSFFSVNIIRWEFGVVRYVNFNHVSDPMSANRKLAMNCALLLAV